LHAVSGNPTPWYALDAVVCLPLAILFAFSALELTRRDFVPVHWRARLPSVSVVRRLLRPLHPLRPKAYGLARMRIETPETRAPAARYPLRAQRRSEAGACRPRTLFSYPSNAV
jgi:hypothetical protein